MSHRRWLLVGAVLAVTAAVLVWTNLESSSGWQVQASHMAPFAVRFINQRDGWVAGDGGVLRTVDGGRHWRKVEGKYAADVFVLDPTHVWAVGPHGMIWGPEGTWRAFSPGVTANDLNGVAFADPARGWAVGAGGMILSSIDGGKHWQRQHCPTHSDLERVACADASHVWVVGGATFSTSDGGRHWVRRPGVEGLDVTFINSRDGWMVGGEVYRTTDGGRSWRRAAVPLPKGSALATLDGVAFSDPLHGYAVGFSFSGGSKPQAFYAIETSDGGRTWHQVNVPQPAAPSYVPKLSADHVLTGVSMPDVGHCWIVGATPAGVILSWGNLPKA